MTVARDRAAGDAARLREVTAALLQATTVGDVVDGVLSTALPAVGAATGSIGVVRDDTALDVWRRTGPDPCDRVEERLPVDTDLPGAATVRDGAERWYPDLAEAGAEFPRILTRLPDLGPGRACAWLPLAGSGGRRFGFLGLQLGDAGPPDEDGRELVRAAAAQCATALERARLHESDRQAHDRLRRVAEVTSRLAAAATTADVAGVLVDHGVDAFGAAAGAVHLLVPGGHLVLVGSRGWPPSATARFRRFHVDDDLPASHAVRTGRPVVLSSVADLRRQFPALAAVQADVGMPAWVMVPIVAGPEPVGVLGLSFRTERRLDRSELQLLDTLAATAGQAFQRARAHEAVSSVALDLQRALLPTRLPSHPSFEAAGAYVPAPGPAEVGGDWYEVLVGERDALFVIGDVAGHGVEAAVTMAAVRHGLAALSLGERDPALLLALTNTYLRSVVRDTLVTCCVVRLELATGAVTWATAGHPPVVVADGAGARLLDGPVGAPLGVADGATYATAAVPLDRGATLVLYTDGLVERRGETISAGLARLRRAVAEAGDRRVRPLARHLLASLGDGASDDVALLVVSVGGPPA